MIKFTYSNLNQVDQKHSTTDTEINAQEKLISEYLKKIHNRKQGFYEILDDQSTIAQINEFAQKTQGQYENIVILGIGGSSLGAIAIREALTNLYPLQKSDRSNSPSLYIIDNIDPQLIAETTDFLNLTKTLFLVITKSGETPETLAQFFYFYQQIQTANLDPKKHFVIVTDPQKGLLREIAQKENFTSFSIPQNVGGRFSVLTSVGLLPAALIGINISEMIAGAKEIRHQFLSTNINENLPFQIATIQYQLHKKGKNINVMMPYTQKLFRFADWYRQLLAESIGKKFNNQNQEVFVGITPVNALGATDQHSQSQLFSEGPNDKLIIFLQTKDQGEKINIPLPEHLVSAQDQRINYLKNITFKKLIDTEMHGTMTALTNNDRPNILLEIDQLNAKNLGALFMLFEAATAFLGEYFDINAFDQPGVELSKKLTRAMLTDNLPN